MPQGMGADASSPPRFVDELDERMKKAGEVSGSGRRAKYWPFSSFSSSGTTKKQKKQHRENGETFGAGEEEEKRLKTTTTITEKKTEEDEDEETKTMTIVQRATSDTTKMLISGGVAGAFSKSCTAPLARLTILRQLQGTNAVPGWSNSVVAQKDLGIVKSLRHIVNTEGVRALWKGNGVTIAHRLPYSAINFYTYENTLDFLENEVEGRWNVKEYQAWEVTKRLAAGAFAGCFSCTLTYPLDLVRTRLAAQVTPTVRTSGAATTTTTMNGGDRGGFPARAKRALVASATRGALWDATPPPPQNYYGAERPSAPNPNPNSNPKLKPETPPGRASGPSGWWRWWLGGLAGLAGVGAPAHASSSESRGDASRFLVECLPGTPDALLFVET